MRKLAGSRWPLRLLLVAVCLLAGAAALRRGVRAGSADEAAKDARGVYQSKVAAYYAYKFGSGTPFLPSNATTDTGQFVEPSAFSTAAYCGHCIRRQRRSGGSRRTRIRTGRRGTSAMCSC